MAAAVTVAALYVQTGGVYFGLPDVDPWDEARDARLYDGPWPVVAHPPCQRWCRLAGQLETRWGYRVGDDGGVFAAALAAVRRFGGVLEHPAHSQAWDAFDLPTPATWGWASSIGDEGWSCEIEQGHYGHELRKPTWLYCVGADPPGMRWGPSEARRLKERGQVETLSTRVDRRGRQQPARRERELANPESRLDYIAEELGSLAALEDKIHAHAQADVLVIEALRELGAAAIADAFAAIPKGYASVSADGVRVRTL